MAVEFRILGSTEIRVDGVTMPIGPAQQQCVLAALLVDVNQIVLIDQLVERVWGGRRAPADARNSLRSYLSRLRKIADVRIERRSSGYVLVAESSSVDLHRFRTMVTAAYATDDEDHALDLFGQALTLWRGEPLAGLGTPWADTLRAALETERIAVELDHTDLRLKLGDHSALVAGLAGQTLDRPLDERLAGQLMLALYRCGRQAEALAHYDGLRTRLADELGIDPMPELRELHQRILRSAGDLRVTATAPRAPSLPMPQQLPAAVTDFTGRAGAFKELDETLPGHTAVVISAIAGTAGVGKTALAVEWAHRVAARFPDGQLYVNLRGYGPGLPMRPLDAVARFLRSLGLAPEQQPVDVDEAAGLFRSLLANRRVLVLLDNAATPDQVRPLLPGSGGCLVLVTSRDRLDGLVACDGARRLTLDVLTEEEAGRLLARIVGAERIGREPQAVAELIRLTARLPLALRIAAAKLVSHPGGIADYVARLRTGDQLGSLEIQGDERATLRSTFDLSYQALTADQQRLFRLLGLFPGPDFAPDAVAALIGVSARPAATLLDDLTAAHLIDQHQPGRYAFHDLLRRYASERSRVEDSEQDRRTALRQLSDWYLRTADAAAKAIHPQLLRLPVSPNSDSPSGSVDRGEALTWLDNERANVVAIGMLCAEEGPRSVAWLLADTLRGYFWVGLHHPEWSALGNAALTAAEEAGDAQAMASVRLNLGDAFLRRHQPEQAIEQYTQATAALRLAGWMEGQAVLLGKLGLVYRESGDARKATDCYQHALVLAAQTGKPVRQATSLGNLGFVHYELGRYELAAAAHAKALGLYRELGIVSGQATALGNLGDCLHALGRFAEALTRFTQALPMFREMGDVGTEAATLRSIAALDRDTGRAECAAERARAALELARQSGDGRVEAMALNTVGTIHQRRGRAVDAARCHQEALDLARSSRIRYTTVDASIGLAVARADLAGIREAFDRANAAGYRGLAGHALTAMTRLLLSRGETAEAGRHAEQALRIHRETGHRLGEARTLTELANIAEATRGTGATQPWREEARDAFVHLGIDPT